MAPSRPANRSKKQKKTKKKHPADPSPEPAQTLLEQATSFLHSGQPESAVQVAQKLLECLASVPDPLAKIPALELLGEIYVELGDGDQARQAFGACAALDPDGNLTELEGGGADKFLWLAQLSEEGGADSLHWFEKGITVLKRELDSEADTLDDEIERSKRRKLANALCGATELYMTDLSWEDDAEARCEALITEACLVAPDTPEPLQTMASVRISQMRLGEACAALTRSMDLWTELAPEDPRIPDFPTRISLARLLMEVEMEEKAFEVLDRLTADDDHSVEAWYLGGWCLRLLAIKLQKQKQEDSSIAKSEVDAENVSKLLRDSRKWLKMSLKLYTVLEYEDDRLHDHATELVTELNKDLGIPADVAEADMEDDDDDDEDEGWESNDSDEEDTAMAHS